MGDSTPEVGSGCGARVVGAGPISAISAWSINGGGGAPNALGPRASFVALLLRREVGYPVRKSSATLGKEADRYESFSLLLILIAAQPACQPDAGAAVGASAAGCLGGSWATRRRML